MRKCVASTQWEAAKREEYNITRYSEDGIQKVYSENEPSFDACLASVELFGVRAPCVKTANKISARTSEELYEYILVKSGVVCHSKGETGERRERRERGERGRERIVFHLSTISHR